MSALAGNVWDMRSIHVDCNDCAARGPACGDCVISVLLGPPGEREFGQEEQRALGVLADAGLVPPLRMVTEDVTGAFEKKLRAI